MLLAGAMIAPQDLNVPSLARYWGTTPFRNNNYFRLRTGTGVERPASRADAAVRRMGPVERSRNPDQSRRPRSAGQNALEGGVVAAGAMPTAGALQAAWKARGEPPPRRADAEIRRLPFPTSLSGHPVRR
jgi:hypothetical protein